MQLLLMVLSIYSLQVILVVKAFLGESDVMRTKPAQSDAPEDTYITEYFELFGDGIFIVCEECCGEDLTSCESAQGKARCRTSELGKLSVALVSIPIISTGISSDA